MTVANEPLINLAEIAEIELFVLKRMRELTLGDHASVFKGTGFNLVGIRDWEPGDRASSIDWAQSSLNNFSPMIVRDFEQNSTANVLALADASLSTRCGINGVAIGTAIARSIAAVGLSAVLLQDRFGLIAFDQGFRELAAVPPRIGKPQVLFCLDVYQRCSDKVDQQSGVDALASVSAHLRRTSLVPVVSDFLFDDAPRVIGELARLNAEHDVLLVMIDARFAYRLSAPSDGWIRTYDVENGVTRVLSRHEFRQLEGRVEQWQQEIETAAHAQDLDIVRIGLDRWEMETTLSAFLAERRLRKVDQRSGG